MRIIISGGGTGGHIFPAIAVANVLKAQDSTHEILFVGAEGKMEMEKVPQAGYNIVGLPIVGFQRRLTLANVKNNLFFPFKLAKSIWRAYKVVKDFQPDVAVGFGGYASGPVLQMAGWLNVPTVIQEQNSYAGVTNKILAKKAAAICVAYTGMERFFPKEKIKFTGNPVRQDIVAVASKRKNGIAYFGLDATKKTIVILGGSLGARTLNDSVVAATDLLEKHPEIQILWQAGKLYMEDFGAKPVAKLPNVHIRAFIDKMDLAYSAADVLIARAGALTVSELCLVGKPVILVPSPNVAEDHQTKNALSLSDVNAAILILDKDAAKSIPKALAILQDVDNQHIMKENIIKLAKPHAAQDIAGAILDAATTR
jgi:UDP-N-acetylglucosamine--N-acetylmuramyl-(pentapeptide) pyrophosphoryl-undecaprenol N-acetylglucosamine transferase